MTPEQFCYWLQGFFELTRRGEAGQPVMGINHEQTTIIRDHLNLVFKKVTPETTKKVINEQQEVKKLEKLLKREAVDPYERYCSSIDKEIC